MSRESLRENKSIIKTWGHKATPRPQQTARINNTVFQILESGSKASRSRYGSAEASSHTLVDHDMERVTQLCKLCQTADKTQTAPPRLPV